MALGSHLPVTRTLAIVTMGPRLRENPAVYGEGRPLPPQMEFPADMTDRPKTGPPVILEGASTDYTLRIEEVLGSGALGAGDSATLRLSGAPNPPGFNPFPHPREGQRLLMVLVSDLRPISSGTYSGYAYGAVDVSGKTATFIDAWRTSVKEMGAPESTPAFIEAVRAAAEP